MAAPPPPALNLAPSPPSTLNASGPAPLTPDQMRALGEAQARMKRIRRAVGVASFDGWTVAVFGLLTLLSGFWGFSGILLGLGMGAVAYVELRTAPRLLNLDAKAAQTLAYNQLALAGMLIVYALWCLLAPSDLDPQALASAEELRSLGVDLQALNQLITRLVYSAVIVVSICAQGSMALFYYRRIKMIQHYVATTPPWVVQMQQSGFGV